MVSRQPPAFLVAVYLNEDDELEVAITLKSYWEKEHCLDDRETEGEVLDALSKIGLSSSMEAILHTDGRYGKDWRKLEAALYQAGFSMDDEFTKDSRDYAVSGASAPGYSYPPFVPTDEERRARSATMKVLHAPKPAPPSPTPANRPKYTTDELKGVVIADCLKQISRLKAAYNPSNRDPFAPPPGVEETATANASESDLIAIVSDKLLWKRSYKTRNEDGTVERAFENKKLYRFVAKTTTDATDTRLVEVSWKAGNEWDAGTSTLVYVV